MTFQQPIFGYTGQVWSAAFQAMQFLQSQIAAAPTASETDSVAQATLQTIRNALAALNAQTYANAWQQEALLLGQVRALPMQVDSTSLVFLNARAKSMLLASQAMAAIVPQPPFGNASQMLAQGAATIPDPDLVGFYDNFNFEVPPGGLTVDNLVGKAEDAALAFGTVANDVATEQGSFLTQAYDTAVRAQTTQQAVVDLLSDMTSSGFSVSGFTASAQTTSGTIVGGTQALWNQMAVLPAFLIDAALLSSTPYSLASQQSMVVRNAMLSIANQLALFLLVLRQPSASNINLARVQQNDNLMDVAARSLGNFERWADIATTNDLKPPYTGATKAPGVAPFGSQLIMPTTGTQVSPVGQPPSYAVNFLGVDLYLGPINQTMLPWRGDFQTIAGYSNLAQALGRRLQTALGALIYHTDYGSLLPTEAGSVQSNAEAGRIAAFGKSTLLADPRVAAVLSATAQILENGQVSFQGVVQPAGFGTQTVSVNVVIGS